MNGGALSGWEQPKETRPSTTSEAAHRLLLGIGAVAAVLVAILVALVFVLPLDLPFMQVPATITPAVAVDGRLVHVTATTNLPDGAVISYYVGSEAHPDADDHGGTAVVRGGRYEFVVDLSDWPSGKATLYDEFSVSYYGGNEQPQNVVDVFGSQGEHMSGPQVYVDSPGDPKRLFVTVPFDLPA